MMESEAASLQVLQGHAIARLTRVTVVGTTLSSGRKHWY